MDLVSRVARVLSEKIVSRAVQGLLLEGRKWFIRQGLVEGTLERAPLRGNHPAPPMVSRWRPMRQMSGYKVSPGSSLLQAQGKPRWHQGAKVRGRGGAYA